MLFTYARYLAAKKSVDDRALNKDVLERLRPLVRPGAEIVELGAGLGTMVARLIEWGVLRKAAYTLVDQDLSESRTWLGRWAAENGYSSNEGEGGLRLRAGEVDVEVRFVHSDLAAYLTRAGQGSCDLLVANAFLDLVDLQTVLPQVFRLLRDRGSWWFTINFDGETIFEPEHPLDELYMRRYHEGMDSRPSGGHSRTGRRLFAELAARGLLAAGASDWVVYPPYVEDEAYFLHHILHTIEEGIQPEPDWLQLRRQQIQREELVYIAHQLDFVGQLP
jgi:hypothetical protein